MIRLAPIALYNSYEDVAKTIQILKDIMETQKYKMFPNVPERVA